MTKFFLVALRIAIGWHLCYEGLTKIQSHWTGKSPFSSEMYLRYSTGPFRGHFRGLVDDFFGLESLDAEVLASRWKEKTERTLDTFGIEGKARADALAKVASLTDDAKKYLAGDDTKKKIASYKEKVEAWVEADKASGPTFSQEEHRKAERDLDATRLSLTQPIRELKKDLETTLAHVTADTSVGWMDVGKLWWAESSQREKVDFATMGILTICGGLLVVGLFSRLAALGAASLLVQFYFSMPPWPGLPPNPVMEGSYFIVNKTLIELLATLTLATCPTGVWGGLDALVRGLITRPLFGVGAAEVRDRAR